MSENAEIARLQAENAALRRRIAEQDDDRQRLERLLQTTIDHVDSVIYLRDATGTFTHINDTYEKMTGLSRENVIGRRDSDVFPKEVYEAFRVADRQVVEGLATVTQEELLPQEDGMHVFRSYKFPVLDAAGRLIAQGGISTDLTKQRRAEASLQATRSLLQAIVENAPLAILATDAAHKYVLVSNEAARQVGRTPAEVLGKRVPQILPPGAAEAMMDTTTQVFRSGGTLVLEQTVPWEGSTKVFLTHMFPIRNDDGEIDAVGTVATDVTDMRRAEGEHLRLQEEIIRAQRSTLLELSTPIIPIAEGVLAVPLIGAIDHERNQQIAGAVLERITATRAAVVILDLTGVRQIDPAIVDALMQTVRAMRMLGAEAVLTGISPELARVMADLDAPLRRLTVRQTLQHGIGHALTRIRERKTGNRRIAAGEHGA
ncbi:anti-anti-sigma factor [Nannocystis exedens]|uniref:Anti-anti-sigma factor n=1 Tax=Nannocystis exedens TaxID=54 RepID=A0A1I2CUT9_9BACT|nr:PAS domain-containing protein [Nannocystis exedens]PCC68590.1 anti-anti sigma factor protein [Nannocystis exedens]SFE71955.1 anti-anti-sigma factor [Nannocystis exedens]